VQHQQIQRGKGPTEGGYGSNLNETHPTQKCVFFLKKKGQPVSQAKGGCSENGTTAFRRSLRGNGRGGLGGGGNQLNTMRAKKKDETPSSDKTIRGRETRKVVDHELRSCTFTRTPTSSRKKWVRRSPGRRNHHACENPSKGKKTTMQKATGALTRMVKTTFCRRTRKDDSVIPRKNHLWVPLGFNLCRIGGRGPGKIEGKTSNWGSRE